MTQEFEFDDELMELRAMVREFCREVSPESVVRATMETETGWDPALWRRLGSELGVLGLAVPEECGGDGVGLVAQAIVVEELGAALVCGPVLGTLALAMPALSAISDADAQRDLLPGLCSGERTATLAAPITTGTFDEHGITVTALETEAGWRLSGSIAQVPDAVDADILLIVARSTAGVSLFAVDGDAPGLRTTPLTTLDLTRQQAAVELTETPARLLANGAEAHDIIEHTAMVAAVLLAAEQVGGSQAMLDATVAHVSTRIQFGQPVGAYQAVKHRCANMLIALEQARSAAYHGAWALQDGLDDSRLAASLAKGVASEAYAWISTSAIQMHGGLGFTWEGAPQLYFKRATTDALTLGTTTQHFDRVARYALDDASLLPA